MLYAPSINSNPLWLFSLVTSRHCDGFELRIIVDLGELHIIKAAVLTMALY